MLTMANKICHLFCLTSSWPQWYPEKSVSPLSSTMTLVFVLVPFLFVSVLHPSLFLTNCYSYVSHD